MHDADADSGTASRPTRAEIIRDLRTGAGQVANVLAIVITAAAAIFAGILVLHIVFVLFKATPTNSIVKHVNSYAHHLAGPFRTLFAFKSKRQAEREADRDRQLRHRRAGLPLRRPHPGRAAARKLAP